MSKDESAKPIANVQLINGACAAIEQTLPSRGGLGLTRGGAINLCSQAE